MSNVRDLQPATWVAAIRYTAVNDVPGTIEEPSEYEVSVYAIIHPSAEPLPLDARTVVSGADRDAVEAAILEWQDALQLDALVAAAVGDRPVLPYEVGELQTEMMVVDA